MATTTGNIMVCPSCGHENIEGVDTCENCLADLRTIDVPETRQIVPESDLTLPISSIRFSRPQTVGPTASVREAIATMLQGSSGAVVVVEAAKVVGIFTERDVLKKVAGREEFLGQPISMYMTHDPVVLRDDDMVAYALNKMGDGGFRHIPITKDGALIGVATARDVMSWVVGKYFD
jgi:CBS domain-containing protein